MRQQFYHRLAEHLGKSLAEIENLSSREIERWMAWEQLNGWIGAQRGDVHCAHIVATIANAHRTKRRAFKLLECLPFKLFGLGGKKAQTMDEMYALLRGLSGKGK